MAGRLGSLGSLAPLGSLRGGFTNTDEEDGERKETVNKLSGFGGSQTSSVMGRGSSSLSSLAPLGRPGSSGSGGGSLVTGSSSMGGLGSLTTLSANKPPTTSFNLDDGFDALLDAPTTIPATTASRKKDEPKKKKKSYDSESGGEDSDDGGRKKEKKKKSKKKDEVEDKSKRPLPTRKLPVPRPSTAPIGDFDDDSLFGIKKEVSTTSKRASLSKSQSVRESATDDWDDYEGEGEQQHAAQDEEVPETRSGDSTARRVSAAMKAKELQDQRVTPPARMEEPSPVPLTAEPTSAPKTFGSRRARANSNPGAQPSVTPSPELPTTTTPAPTTTTTTTTPTVTIPTSAPTPTAAAETFMPTSPDGDDSVNQKVNLRDIIAKKRAEKAAAAEAATQPSAAASTLTAPTPATLPPPVVANSKSLFDDMSSPLDESITQPTPTSQANLTTEADLTDPFGNLDNPIHEIDEKQGNLFSGFGSARPATASAPAARARRALPTFGRVESTPVSSSTRINSAPHVTTQSNTVVPQRQPVPPTVPAAATTISPTLSSTSSSTNAPSHPLAAGPPGPGVAPTFELWCDWLNIHPRHYQDEKLVPIAHAAASAKLPANWLLQNGWWINTRNNTKHRRHPFLKHFLGKVDSKKLAMQFNVEDEDDLDESIVASGDETLNTSSNQLAPGTPSSINRSFDDTNPLSPISPKTRKIEATAHQPPPHSFAPNRPNAAANQGPSALSVNTSAAASSPNIGSGILAANMTPSPYYPSGAYGAANPSPPNTGFSTSSGAITMLPSHDPQATRANSLQRLESVPERNSLGSMDELLSTTKEKNQRLADMERLSNERIAQAQQTTVGIQPIPPSLASGVGGGSSMDYGRFIELQNQLRIQQITIEELEKRKRILSFELENADIHLAQLLTDQRTRFESQLLENERKYKSDSELKREEFRRTESALQIRVQDLEAQLKQAEARKTNAVKEAVLAAETKAREAMDHAVRVAQEQTDMQRIHHEREIESLRILHANEMNSLKQQQHDSVFLRSLVNQVENSAANLESLSKKVYQERHASERLTFDQLQVRDQLLREKEAALEKDRKHNEELILTFQRLARENDEEKVRLREEHLRLSNLQNDLKTESTLLRDQLVIERDELRKERSLLHQQKEAWDMRYKRESTELELKKEMNERAHVQALSGLEEAQRERAEILKSLDDEREEIRLEKRAQNQRRSQLDAAEASLRSDEAEFAQHVAYVEQRMRDLETLGNKVKKQSAEVAEQFARLGEERALVEQAKKEARQLIEDGQKAKQQSSTLTDQLKEEKKEHEREKVRLLAEQKKLLLDKDLALREMQVSKSLAGYHASLPPHLSGHHTPIHRSSYSVLDEPTLIPRVYHSSPVFDSTGFNTAPSPLTPSSLSTYSTTTNPIASLPMQSISTQPTPLIYDSDHITAVLASLTSHQEHMKTFLADEKIMNEQ